MLAALRAATSNEAKTPIANEATGIVYKEEPLDPDIRFHEWGTILSAYISSSLHIGSTEKKSPNFRTLTWLAKAANMITYGDVYRTVYRAGADFESVLRPTKALTRFISKHHFPENARVIDFACGEGRDAIYLARRGFDVLGIDSSRLAVESARGRALAEGVDVDFQVGDMTSLSTIRAMKFDLVINIDALHLVVDPSSRARHFREAYRVLKRGGLYFLCTHAGKREARTFGQGFGRRRIKIGNSMRTIRVPLPASFVRTKLGYNGELDAARFKVASCKLGFTDPIKGPVCVAVARKF